MLACRYVAALPRAAARLIRVAMRDSDDIMFAGYAVFIYASGSSPITASVLA